MSLATGGREPVTSRPLIGRLPDIATQVDKLHSSLMFNEKWYTYSTHNLIPIVSKFCTYTYFK